MKYVRHFNLPLFVCQTVFFLLGLWTPTTLKDHKKILFNLYSFVFFLLYNGSYIIIQGGYLCQVWGNVPLMTGAIFLLFTDLALSVKIFNVYWKKKAIQEMIAEAHTELSAENRPEGIRIIKRNNREIKVQMYIYSALAYSAIIGWTLSAEKGGMLVPAWYPYDATKSPAYELSYAHQCLALSIAACLNICYDILVTTLINQCQCRFNLLLLSLRAICDGLIRTKKGFIRPKENCLVDARLRRCVKQHQAILHQAAQLQEFFSIPILGQFGVSTVIICVTGYQMAHVVESLMWFISMIAYLAVMIMQVFIYCYHGNQLVIESKKVADAVYECPWYVFNPAQRRCLLLVMVRAQRETRLKAGGLTELSLPTSMAVVKASYTFFTVLQSVEDGPKK